MAKKIIHISKEQAEKSQIKLEEMMNKDELGKEELVKLEEIENSIVRKHKKKEEKNRARSK